MEQQAVSNALERIENPILIILIAVLLIAVGALWMWARSLQSKLLEALLKNVEAMTNINTTLSNMNYRLGVIEDKLPSSEK